MKYEQINSEQRYAVSCMLKQGIGKKEIAKSINRSYSTVYREISRNSRPRGSYDAVYAQLLATERKDSGHLKKRFSNQMEKVIKEKLMLQWSPEQIKGWCDLQEIEMVSHERIYQFIWQDKHNGGELYKQLRTGEKKYRKRYGKKDSRGKIKDRVPIEKRPEIVDQKTRFGDWEADLIIGHGHSGAVLTVVERTTGYLLMVSTDGKKANSIKKQMINLLAPVKEKVLTITNDNGKEFMQHKAYGIKLEADVFFCNPYASWERGLNEYTNKLIRQYLPKSISLKNINPLKIIEIQNTINNRPRKKLGYKTPNQIFLDNFNQKLALAS